MILSTTLRWREIDWKLVGAALLLSVIGIAVIFSSLYYSGDAGMKHYYLKQLVWLVIALGAFAVTVSQPIRLYDFVAYIFYAVMVLMLAAVLVVGSSQFGAARWFSLGPINFQPSEFAKLAVLLALARFFAYTKLPPESKKRLVLSFILVAIPAALILKQPDLGTSLVYFMLLFSLWFFSGLPPLYLILIVSPIISLVMAFHWLAWALYFLLLLAVLFVGRPSLSFAVIITIINLFFGMMTPLVWNRLADYQKCASWFFSIPAAIRNEPDTRSFSRLFPSVREGCSARDT